MRFLIFSFLVLGAVPAVAAPTAPTNVVATAASGTSVTITWNAVTGATGYRVYLEDEQITEIAASGTTSFTNTGLTPDTTYQYSVSAFDLEGESARTDAAPVTTPVTPAVPTGLRGAAGTDGVVLNWNSVSGATEYIIFRDGVEIDSTDRTTYLDSEVETATTYRYSVAASNAAGESDESAAVTVATKGDGSAREAVWTRAFNAADGNFDGIVEFDEYLNAHPVSKLPEAMMYNRFLGSDDDDSLDLTVDEYIAYFGGKKIKRPSKAQLFHLADTMLEDGEGTGDGLLDVVEYALTKNRGTKEMQVLKKFDKLDKNDSGYLSEREFGLRYGATEDDF